MFGKKTRLKYYVERVLNKNRKSRYRIPLFQALQINNCQKIIPVRSSLQIDNSCRKVVGIIRLILLIVADSRYLIIIILAVFSCKRKRTIIKFGGGISPDKNNLAIFSLRKNNFFLITHLL